MATEIIFSFDTEDFTSNDAADAIYREAEVLRKEGVKGGFCVVGLLAKQLITWGRTDVLEALKHHDILSHSYGHTLHPTINEYTDLEDFEEAYREVIRQEIEGLRLINEFTGGMKIYGACPPGNQKSYVAMYAYADMGLPIYADTMCDTPDGRGAYYCNIYQTQYTFCLENFLRRSDEDYMREVLDSLAEKKRAICFTHPNAAMFTEFWDTVNYYKENKCEFGQWKACARRPVEDTEKYYDSIAKFIRMIKADERFRITSYGELEKTLKAESERVIEPKDIDDIRATLKADFAAIDQPSLSIADVFLACREFLCGERTHTCGKVYGFLEEPYSATETIVVMKAEMMRSAQEMRVDKFLPTRIRVGEREIGPADWLFAALDILAGNDHAVVEPKAQMPDMDIMPRLKAVKFKGGWMQSDEFEDKYLSDRLRLQAWTMRFI